MTELRAYHYIVESVKPKTATVKCTVPECDCQWFLEGGHQGFTLASAQSHCRAHWRKYHEEQNHPLATWAWIDSKGKKQNMEGQEFCELCKKIAEKEYSKHASYRGNAQ